MTRTGFVIAALCLATALWLSAAAPGRAGAFCTNVPGTSIPMENWVGQPQVPVYVDSGLIGKLMRPGGAPWTFVELVREVHWATTAIATQSAAELPHLYYAGLSPDCGGTEKPHQVGPCHVPGSVVVTYGFRDGAAGTGGAVPPADGMVITFNDSEEWRTSTTGDWTFLGALVHELLHTLGLSHPWDCSSYCAPGEAPCSAVGGDASVAAEQQHLYLDDAYGLRSVYGARDRSVDDHHESTDPTGGSWWGVPVPLPATTPLMQASSSPDVLSMFVGTRDPATLEPIAYEWNWLTFAWARWGEEMVVGPQVGATGAAWDHDDGWGILGHQSGESVSTVTKTLTRTLFTAPHLFWTATVDSTTRRPGVSAAYQSLDGLEVFATRSTAGQVELHWIEPGGSYAGPFPLWDGATGPPVYAYDTPSVACGDVYGLYYNCLVAWASDDTAHTLRWMHFGIHPDAEGKLAIVPELIRADDLMLDSAPQVAFRGPAGGTAAWVLAFTQKVGVQHVVYTLHKGIEASSTWDPGSWFVHGPYAPHVSAAIGSANASAELLVTN